MKKPFLNDRFILFLISVNSITLFIQAFDGISQQMHSWMNILDTVITILFVIEVVVKIRECGARNYLASNWNRMDVILVALSIPAIFTVIFHAHISNLSFLLIFRISRVFKFFRFIKFIPGIDHIAAGVRRALKDSILVLLGFLVYNFIVSVFSCYLFKEISPVHFGNPLSSFYSTFKIFTVEGWYEIPDKIFMKLSSVPAFFSRIYFILILLTGGVFGLSLVNSIFVDAMVADNTDDLEAKVDELNKKIDTLTEMYEKSLHKLK